MIYYDSNIFCVFQKLNVAQYLNGAKYFSSGVLEKYLVFISANKYIEIFSGTQGIYSWSSKGMSEESIKNPRSDNTFTPSLINYPLLNVKFDGHCLINSNISIFRKVINLYNLYALDTWSRDLNTDFT